MLVLVLVLVLAPKTLPLGPKAPLPLHRSHLLRTVPLMVRVCFVCLGNICRSPTAEGIFRRLVRDAGLEGRVAIDSAGTGDWHVGEAPDARATAAAAARGVTLGGKAQQFTSAHFDRYDVVVAMDRDNRRNLERLARGETDRAKIHLLRSFDATSAGEPDVPDPYYGGIDGFAQVFAICERGCDGLLEHLRTTCDLR